MPDYSELFVTTGGEKWYVYVDDVLYVAENGSQYSRSKDEAQERAIGALAENPTANKVEIKTEQVVRMNIGLMGSISASIRPGVSPITPPAVTQIVIDTVSLADGMVGSVYYADPLQASGGNGTYTWTVVSGSLPPGLSITSGTDVIQGTPTGNTATYNFTLRCSDGTNNPAQKALSIFIADSAAVAITDQPGTIPAGYVDEAYSHQFTATGGDGTYVWTETSTNGLPSGMTLSSGGLLSGTPTQTWNYWINVWADDEQGNAGSTDLYDSPWTVHPARNVVSIDQTTLSDATEDAAYSEQLSAVGGDGTYTWSRTAGAWPTGITMNSSGLISGTPTETGSFNVTIQCDDGVITPAVQQFTLTVNSATADVTVTTTSLPSAVNGTAYSQQLAATGGDGTYTWSLTAGSWPTGITMSSAGLISGTPTANGTFNVTVEADDGQGNGNSTDTQALSLIVSATSVIVHIDWNYADRATMLAATPGGGSFEAAGDAGGLGDQRPATLDGSAYFGPAGPWGGTTVLENYYGVIPADWQPQVALNYVFSTPLSEFWQETYLRCSPSWEHATPDNPNYPGNIDKKSMFWFEENYARRWEIKMGPYGSDCIASVGTHGLADYGYMIMTDPLQAAPQTWPISPDSDKVRPVSFTGTWRQIRVHCKHQSGTGVSDGAMEVWLDGTKVIEALSVDTLSGGRGFRHCTFGGNKNQGTTVAQSEIWGPSTFYSADPGW